MAWYRSPKAFSTCWDSRCRIFFHDHIEVPLVRTGIRKLLLVIPLLKERGECFWQRCRTALPELGLRESDRDWPGEAQARARLLIDHFDVAGRGLAQGLLGARLTVCAHLCPISVAAKSVHPLAGVPLALDRFE